MISEIQDLSNKSWRNYSSESNFFNRKNIVFGKNGRGKSSLAEGIVAQQTIINEKYRFFNEKFIDDHLIISSKDGIKGARADFGSRAVFNARKIESLQNEIVGQNRIDSLETDVQSRINKRIKDIFNAAKGDNNIQLRTHPDYSTMLIPLRREYNKAKEQLGYDDTSLLSFVASSSGLQDQLSAIELIEIPKFDFPGISDGSVESIVTILNNKYDSENFPPPETLRWIEEGINIHSTEDGDQCSFCENKLDIQYVIDKFEKYINDTRQIDLQRLLDMVSLLNDMLAWIQSNDIQLKRYQEYFNLENTYDAKLIEIRVNEFKEVLDSKIENFDSRLKYNPEDFLSSIKDLQGWLDNLKVIKTEKQSEVRNQLDNIATLVKGSIFLKVINDPEFKLLTNLLLEKISIKNKIIEDNNSINNEIRSIREQSSDYSDFMNFLNEILELLDLKFRLRQKQNEENIYVIRDLDDKPISVSQISEGEKRLLSLIYFYYELFEDSDQKQFKKSDIELIVIDDPISSLDEDNRFYIIEIIRAVLNIKDDNLQIFILTHSWQDFCDMTYFIKNSSSRNETDYSFYEVKKTSGETPSSYIQKLDRGETPYIKLYREIFDISTKTTLDDLPDCSVYHSYNSMRKVFEEFLKFKSTRNILPQQNQINSIVNIIEVATGSKYKENHKLKLASFLSAINIHSHKAGRGDEIIEHARFMMNLIEKIDKTHHNAIINGK